MLHRDMMIDARKRVVSIIEKLKPGKTPQAIELLDELEQISEMIRKITNDSIDFQEVLENLDDNILVADKNEVILYVNSAYAQNTGIPTEAILGKRVSDVYKESKYFTNIVVPDVIKNRKKVMKLCGMLNNPEKLGFLTGIPILDKNGEIRYVAAINKEVSTFTDLHENFVKFVEALNEINHEKKSHFHIYDNSKSVGEGQAVGASPAFRHIYDIVENVSQTDATVLITGESGVGKELVADAIYRNSGRSKMPFIKVNCASIPESLLESELFGYEKGAFSGANPNGKKGLFEAANQGTLLLDEIGDMPLDLQAKLLRAIQSNEITRVGGVRPIKLDIRLIASTNCSLKEKIKDGTFRSDLYYRLHVIPIHVPPLRERQEDIPQLCQYYLESFNHKYNKKVSLDDNNLNLLSSYSWPGNIRELRNVMEYLVVCCKSGQTIDNSILYGTFNIASQNAFVEYNTEMGLSEAVEAYEKEYIRNALTDVHTLKDAGAVLRVDASTVSRKLRQYGLSLR